MVQELQTPSAVEEQELPIDIDHAKFLSWLVDRRRIPRDWHTYLKSARALVRHAQTITPETCRTHLNLELPSATAAPLPYFRAVDILAAVTAADAPSEWLAGQDKDLLGRYKGATARAWSDAVTAFQKKHVFLADCAQVLTRNADVEAPAIKAAIASLHADVAEYARRDAPAVRAAADAEDRFRMACEEFALPEEGDVDYQSLLSAAVEKRVPELLAAAVDRAKDENFIAAVDYYQKFARYVGGSDGVTARNGDGLCTTSRRVIDGDASTLSRAAKQVKEETQPDSEIADVDWGISEVQLDGRTGEESAGDTEVDWGIEIDASGMGVEEVMAPPDPIENKEVTAGAEGAEAGGIDWGDIGLELSNTSAEVKQSNEEELTLADSLVREHYLNDLIELDAFLAQREAELGMSGNTEIGLVMQQASDVPDFVKAVDAGQMSILQESVRRAISAINSAETRRILALQSDEKRLERAARAVLEKKHAAQRMHAAIGVVRQRRAKAAADLATETPKFEELARITRDIKRRTERALSDLYKGRTVHILGEINNVFPPLD